MSKQYTHNGQTIGALNDVTLTVGAGEIFGVVGPSGAGKSTLIRCVNLLEQPTYGSVKVAGQEMTSLTSLELRQARKKIGMIFQHFNLLTSRTVAGNIAFPLEVAGMAKVERNDRVKDLLKLVGLADKAEAYPAQLSGGQKQRVGIARALATQPQVLLSDEATSALDPQNTTAILTLLKDLNRQLGLTILLITHEMEVIKQVCDHVAVLQAGRIIEQGRVYDLIAKPGSHISQALFPVVDVPPLSSGARCVSITFFGQAADQPVLAGLVRNFDITINILAGSIQTITGQRVGRLQVEMTGAQVEQALAYLTELGLYVEVQ
ncbi:MAG TPA: ATP-binding cassette domain-containing protein [Longilinea sp.]|nr:ATP-binding cassette domain-containing protein [Longilinea sp.]